MSDEEDTEQVPYQITWEGEEEPKSFVDKDGTGTATFPDGSTYTGPYVDGKRHGKGTYTWKNGAVYVGTYDAGNRSGVGRMTYPDKSLYIGEWSGDKRHGRGTYTFPNGDRYCGAWVKGAKQGKGTYLYAADGTAFSGQWINGHLQDGTWQFDANGPFFGLVNGSRVEGYYSEVKDVEEKLKRSAKVAEEERKEKFSEIFEKYDADNSGSLSFHEFFRLALFFDLSMSWAQVYKQFRDVDEDKNRSLSKEEFIKFALRMTSTTTQSDFELGLQMALEGMDAVQIMGKASREAFAKQKEEDFRLKDDSNFPDVSRWSIFLCARAGSFDGVTARLSKGASLREKDSHDRTVLHYAAEGGHFKLSRHLLEEGSKWDKALFSAVSNPEIRDLLQNQFKGNRVLRL